ncbi:MAG: SMP-30/gluconolactonase/LRE family protein [Bifidobacteriaceae bacterium]|jgi:gluconolactonase|nr:SMP-30/gluconolactonase/LRE family protein [Bifidobacteriaceae bacterium]
MTRIDWEHVTLPHGITQVDGWPVPGPGLGFVEGPVWDGQDLICAGVDAGLLYRIWPDGTVTAAGCPGGGPNGLAIDDEGTLFVAQSGGLAPRSRRWPGIDGGVQVVRPSGCEYLTTDPYSPNDLSFGPDGWLYVTDPARGPRPSRDARLWRVHPRTGQTRLLASVPWHANGLAFDRTGRLYVADTFNRRIVRFGLDDSAWLAEEETFASWGRGLPDGMTFDSSGNLLVVTVGEGGADSDIVVISPDGVIRERIGLGGSPECSNVALAASGRIAVTDVAGGRVLFGRWPGEFSQDALGVQDSPDSSPFRVPIEQLPIEPGSRLRGVWAARPRPTTDWNHHG